LARPKRPSTTITGRAGLSMERGSGRRTAGEVRRVRCLSSLLTVVCALALAGCNPDKQGLSAAQPRGATVAFDSLDGLPPGLFQKMVGDLNEEAQSRRLAVISREQPSAYRVRGYLAVKVGKRQTTVAWVWGRIRPERTTSATHQRGRDREGSEPRCLGGRR
jgi:hypothetical protein